MIEFEPPIKERSTNDLLGIVAVPEKWNNNAVAQAKEELNHRQISSQEIEKSIQHHQKQTKIKTLKRADESYSIFDFIFHPLSTICEIVISWELKRDGNLRKARQQQWFRIIFLLIVFIIIIICRKSSSL